MRLIAASAAVGAAALFGAPALAQSAAGEWVVSATTPQGTFEAVWTIVDADGGDTIEIADTPPPGAPADAPPMESAISDVVVDGASFSFKRMLSTPQGPFELTYAGMVDGDALTGTATSAFGEIPITGTRK